MLSQFIEEGKLQGLQMQVPAGSNLYQAGAPAEAFYYLLQGSVCLCSPAAGQSHRVSAPIFFGLTDLLKEQYSYTATATTDCRLLCITKEALYLALVAHVPLRLYMLQQLSKQEMLSDAAYE